ncbi:MAG: hypothetical protein KDD62_09870, partial [Bdellovibrionales bacterium]|nr:hypothetical protein [Bdellovibrionales bacterium]
EPEENGNSFLENARIKAIEYAQASGKIAISEDSGLVIPALAGLPGIWSARFSDCEFSPEGQLLSHSNSGRTRNEIDSANNTRVLELMADLTPERRTAWFEIALVVSSPDGIVLFESSATSPGRIAESQSGHFGFGYDSIFIGDRTDDVSFAELDAQRKNLRSHRRKVLSSFSAWTCKLLTKQQEQHIVIDGNDGVGKSTIVNKLRELGWNVSDRGAATKLTDNPSSALPGSNEISFILDAPIEISQERLLKAGRSLQEKYHTKEDLTHYRQKFQAIAAHHSEFILIDASGSVVQTLSAILKVLYPHE